MQTLYAARRYALTRPWAKRVGQEMQQTPNLERASEAVGALLQREFDRLQQVYALDEDTRRVEALLALAYGCFVRAGSVLAHLDPQLARALAHTRLPANLPDALTLPAESFYLHVEGEGGAFVFHDAAGAALDLLLVAEDLGEDASGWLTEAEPVCALRIGYPGALDEQLADVDEVWQPLLVAVLGGLAMMTQPKVLMARRWEAAAPADWVAESAVPDNAKRRQKARAQLLKAGFAEVSFCELPGLAEAHAYASQGYWRRQGSEDKGYGRLVWVAPR